MRSPIEILIDNAVKCLKCGAAMGKCDCWTEKKPAVPDKELRRIAKAFTKGILGKRSTENQCYVVCWPLQGYLSSMGVKCELTEGEIIYEGCEWHHYWLTLPDGRVIDPTASQFVTPKGERMKNLYVVPAPSYYRKYTAKRRNDKISEAVAAFHKSLGK